MEVERRLALFVPLVISLFAMLPNVSAAQSLSADPRTDARIHVGPFYLTPTLILRDLGVDSNVYNEAGEQKSDFTFDLAPHADVWMPIGRRLLFTTSASLGVIYYQTYSRERAIGGDLSASAEILLKRISLSVGGSRGETRQRPNYEIDARVRRDEQSVSVGANVRIFRKLSLGLSGRKFETDFDQDAVFLGIQLRDTMNRRSTSATGTVRYQWTPYTTVLARTEVTTEIFPFAPIRDSDSVRFTSGFEFKPRALISGTASFGFRHMQTRHDEVPDFRGAVLAAQLSYTLLGSTRFTFSGNRDLAYSIDPLYPYFLIDSYGISIRRQIAGKFDATSGLHRHQHDYQKLLQLGRPQPDRQEVIYNWSGSLGYRLGRDKRLGFGIQRWQRNSGAEQRRYKGLRVGTTITIGEQSS